MLDLGFCVRSMVTEGDGESQRYQSEPGGDRVAHPCAFFAQGWDFIYKSVNCFLSSASSFSLIGSPPP